MTGLPNRALFESRLSEALHRAAKFQDPCALFVVDLDGFKKVNSHGEHANPTAWLSEADAAMYSAKHQSTRGGVVVYKRH